MPRPVVIQDEDVLAAARAVFTEKGVQATTAEVAARAGVSEGILFKRFSSKAELFRRAMSVTGETEDMINELLDMTSLETEGDFEQLVSRILTKLRVVVPIILMWQSSGELMSVLQAKADNPRPLRAIKAVASVLGRCSKAKGRDLDVPARILIGAIWHYAFVEIVTHRQASPAEDEAYVRSLARMIYTDLTAVAETKRKRK